MNTRFTMEIVVVLFVLVHTCPVLSGFIRILIMFPGNFNWNPKCRTKIVGTRASCKPQTKVPLKFFYTVFSDELAFIKELKGNGIRKSFCNLQCDLVR